VNVSLTNFTSVRGLLYIISAWGGAGKIVGGVYVTLGSSKVRGVQQIMGKK